MEIPESKITMKISEQIAKQKVIVLNTSNRKKKKKKDKV